MRDMRQIIYQYRATPPQENGAAQNEPDGCDRLPVMQVVV